MMLINSQTDSKTRVYRKYTYQIRKLIGKNPQILSVRLEIKSILSIAQIF